MTTVAVLGSGIMGSALAIPLADNGHEVRLVGTHLDREIIDSVKASRIHPGLGLEMPGTVSAHQLEDAAEAFDGAEIILSGVNSFGVHWAGEQLASLLEPGRLLIAIAKGMEADDEGNLRILPEVLAEPLPEETRAQVACSAIIGPSIAGEVAVRRDTCVVFAGPDQVALDRLAKTFRTGSYHVWTTTDLLGAEICAAMKNCYALSVGFAEGVLERIGGPATATATTTTRPRCSPRARSRCAAWWRCWAGARRRPTASRRWATATSPAREDATSGSAACSARGWASATPVSTSGTSRSRGPRRSASSAGRCPSSPSAGSSGRTSYRSCATSTR